MEGGGDCHQLSLNLLFFGNITFEELGWWSLGRQI